MTLQPPVKHRFEVLDIFRGLFSVMVVFFHMMFFANTKIIRNNLVANSDLFVDFFFVLSGFVIAYTYQSISSNEQLTSFYKKRIRRLYPLHVVMLILFVAMHLLKHSFKMPVTINDPANANNNWISFLSSLFLLNSVKTPGVNDVSWNIASWSISAEMISYLLFGAVVLLISRSRLATKKGVIFILISCAAFAALVAITKTFEIRYTYNYGFLRGIVGFFAGACTLKLFLFIRERLLLLPAGVFHIWETLCLVLIISFVWNGAVLKPVEFLCEFIFMLSILAFAFERGYISALLKRSEVLKKMGRYSYSIYMTHVFLNSIFNIVFVRLLKFPSEAYSYLFILDYYFVYKVSEWTYKHIEMRFASPGKKLQRVADPAPPETAPSEKRNFRA